MSDLFDCSVCVSLSSGSWSAAIFIWWHYEKYLPLIAIAIKGSLWTLFVDSISELSISSTVIAIAFLSPKDLLARHHQSCVHLLWRFAHLRKLNGKENSGIRLKSTHACISFSLLMPRGEGVAAIYGPINGCSSNSRSTRFDRFARSLKVFPFLGRMTFFLPSLPSFRWCSINEAEFVSIKWHANYLQWGFEWILWGIVIAHLNVPWGSTKGNGGQVSDQTSNFY